MMKRFRSLFALLPLAAFLLAGCNDPFGKKTKLDFIVPPQPSGSDVSYVPVLPFLSGLQGPTAVIAGNDNLIYVVDSAAQQLVCFDEAGREQSRMFVPNIVAVAQDRTLDLLALGAESPIGIPEETRKLATIYRISMKTGEYRLGEDKIVKRIQQPFYVRSSINSGVDFGVSFNGIAALPDNRYYVTRSGAGSDPLTRTPNDAILLFDNHDKFVTTLPITGDGGENYTDFFKAPTAIATKPAVSLFIPNTDPQDFLVSTLNTGEDTVLRVRYVTANITAEGNSYTIKPLVAVKVDGISQGAIYQPGRFFRPRGLCIAGDETGYLFVADKDSLLQFSPEGVEGVQLRASANSSKYNKVSFGGTGTDLYHFNGVGGIGYMNKIVYIADKGNKRVCRYKLSSDFQ